MAATVKGPLITDTALATTAQDAIAAKSAVCTSPLTQVGYIIIRAFFSAETLGNAAPPAMNVYAKGCWDVLECLLMLGVLMLLGWIY